MLRIHADWKAIALCLLAASTFWFFNAMNDDHTSDIAYPIEFIYDEEKYVPVDELPDKVRINASGYGWNLLRKTLRLNRSPVTIDLQELNSSRYVTAGELLPILKGQLDDIRVNYVLQDTLNLTFDRVVSKEFPVRVDTSALTLAEDHRITSKISVNPKTVKITGPSQYVRNLDKDSVRVFITEKNLDSDFEEELDLGLDLHPLATAEPDEISIAFKIEELSRIILDRKPELRNFPADSSVIPEVSEIEVSFLVREADVSRLKENPPQVILDLKKLQSDSTLAPVLRKKPDYVSEYRFQPSSVRVTRVKKQD